MMYLIYTLEVALQNRWSEESGALVKENPWTPPFRVTNLVSDYELVARGRDQNPKQNKLGSHEKGTPTLTVN